MLPARLFFYIREKDRIVGPFHPLEDIILIGLNRHPHIFDMVIIRKPVLGNKFQVVAPIKQNRPALIIDDVIQFFQNTLGYFV
jgi:hypothetical protein